MASFARSGSGSAAFQSAREDLTDPSASGSDGAGGGGASGSDQSVSLAPRGGWHARLPAQLFGGFGAPIAEDQEDEMQRGSAELELEGVESLRESSVIVRASPSPLPGPAGDTPRDSGPDPLAAVRSLFQQPAAMAPAPPRQPVAVPPAPPAATPLAAALGVGVGRPAPAAAPPMPAAAPQAFSLWGAPQPAPAPAEAAAPAPPLWGAPQQPAAAAAPPAAAPAAGAGLRFSSGWGQQPPAAAGPPSAAEQQQQHQQQHQHQQPAAAAPPGQGFPMWGQKPAMHATPPPPAPQQELPPGRFGWQRVGQAQSPTKAAAAPPPPRTASGDSWSSSEPDPSAPPQWQPGSATAAAAAAAGVQAQARAAVAAPPPTQPPPPAAMLRHHSSQQALQREASACDPKSSPAKSVDASSFHLRAYSGAAAEAEAAAARVGARAAAPGQRPSRTAALRTRHARQLRQQDRDQFGVPVASTARPFSLWASPQKIGEACTGLGVYFASVKQFIVVALLLSLFCIYPLANNLGSQAWASSYTLVADEAPQRSCTKGWDTSSWVTGSTAGSRCSSSRYNSPYDCPALCTWSSSRLSASSGGQCAGLPPPRLPRASSGAANATCLLHPPCSPAGGGEAGAPDGPCYCCDLQLDSAALPAGSGGSASAGSVPAGQLWVFFLSQLAFLVWVLLLTRSQLHAAHAADARVITASDYTVALRGVPPGVGEAELRQWCSHYGCVLGAFHVPDVGDAIRVAQRLQTLLVRRAESDAWAASDSCSCSAWWFGLWALGGAGRRRLQRQLDAAAHKLRCYERQDLRPTGAALAVFEYAEHAANCIEDHHRSAARRAADAALCGATASAPRIASARVRVSRAPEPSDILWQHTACTGSAALSRRAASAALTLLIMAAGAGVQYGLAVAGERERENRLSQLYRYNTDVDGALDFSSWAAFTASALEVTRLNAISILSGLAVVAVNYAVTLAVRQLAVFERWHTRTAAERWQLVRLSVAYLGNAFVVPLLASHFAGSASSWYSRGGLMESAFYMQLANALLPPLVMLVDLQDVVYLQVISRSARTQAMMNALLAPPEFLLAEQYASAVTTLGVALCWAPVLPVSPLLAALGLFMAYWSDKIVALRRAAHPGNLHGSLVTSAALLIRLLPLAQLLLMRFLYFVDEAAMVPVFWTGLAMWLLFAVAPLRALLGLVPRRRSTVTGGLSYQETLGSGLRQGQDDAYAAEMPPCAAPEYRRQVEGLFRLLPAAQPASEALLPRQDPATGGAATRPPFRPDRSLDLALSRAAASLRLRQQAALGAGGAAAPPGVASPPGSGRGEGPGSAQPGSARTPGGVHHTRHGSAGAGAGGRLVRGLSAVKDSLAEAGSWLWNGRDHEEPAQSLFTYDWRRGAAASDASHQAADSARSTATDGSVSQAAPPAPPPRAAPTAPTVPPPGHSPFMPLGRAAGRSWGSGGGHA